MNSLPIESHWNRTQFAVKNIISKSNKACHLRCIQYCQLTHLLPNCTVFSRTAHKPVFWAVDVPSCHSLHDGGLYTEARPILYWDSLGTLSSCTHFILFIFFKFSFIYAINGPYEVCIHCTCTQCASYICSNNCNFMYIILHIQVIYYSWAWLQIMHACMCSPNFDKTTG